ncbi:MAG TPA: cupin domain-containing protein [Thermoanaerobaculia bacterium]|nr:cupin domain-containing protein [Thermoanaerobaculia bacterium]
MAIELPGGCKVFGHKEGEPFRRAGLDVWRQVGRERGSMAISLSVLELQAGSATAWRNSDGDQVLFVLSGEADLRLDGYLYRLAPDTGVFVRPGGRVGLANPGGQALTLLDSRCPDPGPDIVFEEPPAPESPGPPRSPSPVVRLEDQPIERAGDGRWFRVLVDAKTGSEEVTQFVGFIPPGRAPDHFHEYEEVICILEGRGRFRSGEASAEIAPGSCVYLPRRQPHCVENTGALPLKLHGLFYPAGSPAVRYHPGGVAGDSQAASEAARPGSPGYGRPPRPC